MTEEDKYEKMTDEDFDRILKDIVSRMSADHILSYGDVNAFLREELNNEVLTAWEREQSAKSDQVERDMHLFGEVVRSVSPTRTWTLSYSTPSSSATICASTETIP